MKTLQQTIYGMDLRLIMAKLAASLLLYFAPVAPLVHACLALVIIDFITGYWKSRIVKRRLTSHRLKKTTNKLAAYFTAIITAHIVDASYLHSYLHLPQIMSAYIGFTELTSIYENLSEITGKRFIHDLANDFTKRIKQHFNSKKYDHNS